MSLTTIKQIGRLSSDGILVVNATSNEIEYFNSAFTKIIGISQEKLSAENPIEKLRRCLKDDDEFLQSNFNRLLEKSKVLNLELRVKSATEKQVSCDAYFLKKSSLIFCIVKDITKDKQHSNYLSEFGARKDVILDMVAHNLSGPLNLTNNLMDLIDQHSKTHNFKQIDMPTRLIRENTQHCIEIINSFLKEEHLASKNVYVETNRFDIISKIKIEINRTKQFHPQKQIKLVTDKKELFITGDDVKFFQVIHNVLSNAVKFTNAKGKISIGVTESDGFFRVSVTDDGIGIPEFLQPHVFKKNTQASRPGLKGEKSIGMGLYIVRKLVELMKGTIEFQSVENKGTTFTFQLPKTQ
jgi:two-component system sensor histidine kinase VicK